ncbi:MAG TPA: hypothetical protein VKT78_01760 [Fimbriimonadaceae bacterium]|nr:hypothetical protein [Fimbriimonadaceae bacterium]
MIALLFFAFAQQPADLSADARLDQHVTYRNVATPAKAAIAALAQAASLPLAAGGNIQADILLLRIEDMPIRDVMRKLAHATGASWVDDKGTYYLSRTDADLRRREDAARGAIVAALRKEIAKRTKNLAGEAPFDASAAKALVQRLEEFQHPKQNAETGDFAGRTRNNLEQMQAEAPAGRFGARILSRLDPELLAQAPARRRTVFSTLPTRMEAPISIDFSDAAQAYMADEVTYTGALDAYPEQERMILAGFQGGAFLAPRSKFPPAKVNVVVSRIDDSMEGLNIEIQLYNTAGERISSTPYTVLVDPGFPSERELMADPNEPKLAISPDDLALMQVIGSAIGGKPSKTTVLPAAIRARLLQPEKYEPLSAFASNLLLATADARHLNLLADLPDAYVILGAAPGFLGFPTASSILKLAKALPPSIGPVTVDDKCLEIAGGQASPGVLMGHRADRAALGQLFSTATDDALPIEGLARYAYVGDGVPDDFMLLLLTPLLFPGSEVGNPEQWRALRLVGSLMHHQADAPLKPGRIPFRSLDPDSIAIIENIVFFQRANSFSVNFESGNARFGDAEPCEQLPNGLPPDGYIDVTATNRDTIFSSGAHPQEVQAGSLAYNTAIVEHPEKYGNGRPSYTASSRFRIGKVREIQLQIQLANGVSKNLSVQERHIGHGPDVSFSDLPQSFRQEYQRTKDQVDKQD